MQLSKFRPFKLVFAFVLLTLASIVNSRSAIGASQFTTSYNVIYEVQDNGGARVENTIQIKNNTAEYYVADFTLTIPDKNIKDIKAVKDKKELKTKITEKEEEVEINVIFDQPTIGINKSNVFLVSYTASDVGRINGQNLEVTIPGINEDYKGVYNLDVKIPLAKTSKNPRIFPKPQKEQENELHKIYSYDQSQLKGNTILMSFGDSQIYKLGLTYYLKNPTSKKIQTEISLPPTTEYQQMIYEEILPKPLEVLTDKDNNYLAKYYLEPNQEIEIQVHAHAVVYNQPINQFPELSSEDIIELTKPQEYWEADDPAIKNQAELLEDIKAIYQFTVDTLVYDKDKLDGESFDRLGARKILQNTRSAVCMEFTDLFIALARAKGIPAREINGYALTSDRETRPLSLSQDVLHAWPEYYDAILKRWIPVDPTWGNTTGGMDYFSQFDTNHITFVRKGITSTYPYPAGAYKRDKSSTNVFVNIASELPKENNTTSLNYEGNSWKLAGKQISVQPTVVNEGNVSLLGKFTTNLTGNNQTIKQSQWLHIPPFGKKNLEIQITPHWNERDTYHISLTQNDKTIQLSKNIEVYPIYSHPYMLIGIAYLLVLIGLTTLAVHVSANNALKITGKKNK